MIDEDQIAMLVYSHVVQLTLIDYQPDEAFALAHRVAALGFDTAFTQAGLEAARKVQSSKEEPDSSHQLSGPQPSPTKR